jgi:K+-transporting ATPase ATPase C chain
MFSQQSTVDSRQQWTVGCGLWTEIRRGVLFTLTTMLLLGGGYHGLLWGIGHMALSDQAEGSLERRADGSIIGSRLIAQKFQRAEYFHPRPSAVDYNAASTGGSNYGPSNPEHLKAVRERIAVIVAEDGVTPGQIPSEMVTASGGGLDPHVPPVAADLQAPRVARSRRVEVGAVRELIAAHVEPPLLGIFGRPRVNVLELNLALDARFGQFAPVLNTAREEVR